MGSRRSTTRQTPSASNPLCLPHCFRLFPSTSSPLPPLSPFQLAQKCAPASPQVQNPALKCARPSSSGFKMRAACAPRCANFPQNPIFSPKTHKTKKISFFALKPFGPNAEILLCLRGDFWQEKSVGNRSQSACAGGDTGSSPQTAPSKSADRNPL